MMRDWLLTLIAFAAPYCLAAAILVLALIRNRR
jgi:hypothetical protein